MAAASTHIFVDTPAPSVVDRDDYPPTALIKRAELMGRVLTSAPVVERIGRRAGIAADEISTGARLTQSVPVVLTEPLSEERASQIAAEARPYRIEVQARQATPVLDVYTRAPSIAEAERLADAAVAGLDDYLDATAARQNVQRGVRLRQLGPARGGIVNGGMPLAIAILTFLVTFAIVCGVLVALQRRVRGPAAPRRPIAAADDWPRTTRILPWSFAGFIALLWLIPFNDIELTVSLPIDLKLDRLLLPFVVAAWALTLMVGSRGAVRFRPTWIHAGVAVFVLCAFLSVVLEARDLNRSLELEGAVKQLPLLVSYVSLFLIAATAIRPTEVRPFLTYTLVLAVVCAVGVIWEYRMEQNLFYEWSDKLLPGVFELPQFDASVIDNIGRRLVRGPAALPLEAVAMLSMALPIALVFLMQSRRWRDRILYGLAVCVLLAATLATFRKSALLAPVGVVLTVAYFRRSELLRLAPLALVVVVVVHIVAPGAIGRTGSQFDSLGVSTVSDRSADYDAVRPDLWSNLLFGRGWGSYSHESYRILDSEILHRVLEMGVIGLLAYVFMILSAVIFSGPTIAARDPRRAPVALIGAAAGVSFLVISTLFDVLAFPHATYIFLYMAGLVSVVLHWDAEGPRPAAARHEARTHTGARRGAARAPRRPGAGAVG